MIKDNKYYIYLLKDSVDKLLEYTDKINLEEFESSSLIQDAIVRRFDIIVEACSCLSKDIKDKSDFIPWDKIIDIKKRLVNENFEVNKAKVWEVVKEDVPFFKEDINKIIHETNL